MKDRLDQTRLNALSTLLDELIALDAPARAARLEALRRDHPAIAEDVAELLAQHTADLPS